MKLLLAAFALVAVPVMAAEPTLYGRYEYIQLPEIGQTFKAKMDTGALTASLSARDIETFQRDGDDWVRFRLGGEDAGNKVYEHRCRASARSRAAPTKMMTRTKPAWPSAR